MICIDFSSDPLIAFSLPEAISGSAICFGNVPIPNPEESPNDFDKNHQVKVDTHLVI